MAAQQRTEIDDALQAAFGNQEQPLISLAQDDVAATQPMQHASQSVLSDGQVEDILLDPQQAPQYGSNVRNNDDIDPFATFGGSGAGGEGGLVNGMMPPNHTMRTRLSEAGQYGRSPSISSAMSTDLLPPGANAAGAGGLSAQPPPYPASSSGSQASFADLNLATQSTPSFSAAAASSQPAAKMERPGEQTQMSSSGFLDDPVTIDSHLSRAATVSYSPARTAANKPASAARDGRTASGSTRSSPGRSSFGGENAGLPPRPATGSLISPLAEEKDAALPPPIAPAVPPQIAAVRSRLNAHPPPLEPHLHALPTRRWTDPTNFVDVPFVDRLADALSRGFSGIPSIQRPVRRILSIDQAVTMPDPYKALFEARSWRALAQLARIDIIATHPTDVARLSRLWLLRWYAMSRLKFVDLIQKEIDRIGDLDSSDLVFERFADVWPGRHGQLASLELRVFCNLVPAMKGNHYESIYKLYKLLYAQRKLVQPNNPESVAQWKLSQTTILMHVANLLAQIHDYAGASSVLSNIASLRPQQDIDFLAALGRIHLQIGELPRARDVFVRIERHLGLPADADAASATPVAASPAGSARASATVKSTITTPLPTDASALARPDLVLSHRAFLHLAEGEYEAAMQYFTDLVTRSPLHLTAINNLAICQLYSGNVSQAASFLESLAVEAPKKAGACEELVFNLCTIYDLTDHSLDKKKRLLSNVVVNAAGDDFGSENLKL